MEKKFKFEIGDVIVRNHKNPNLFYDFQDIDGKTKPGDTFIISHRGGYGKVNLYDVEGGYAKKPNWLSMEENFDLHSRDIRNWQEFMER